MEELRADQIYKFENRLDKELTSGMIINDLGVPIEALEHTIVSPMRYWSDNSDVDMAVIDFSRRVILAEYSPTLLFMMKDAIIIDVMKSMQKMGMFVSESDLRMIFENVLFGEEFEERKSYMEEIEKDVDKEVDKEAMMPMDIDEEIDFGESEEAVPMDIDSGDIFIEETEEEPTVEELRVDRYKRGRDEIDSVSEVMYGGGFGGLLSYLLPNSSMGWMGSIATTFLAEKLARRFLPGKFGTKKIALTNWRMFVHMFGFKVTRMGLAPLVGGAGTYVANVVGPDVMEKMDYVFYPLAGIYAGFTVWNNWRAASNFLLTLREKMRSAKRDPKGTVKSGAKSLVMIGAIWFALELAKQTIEVGTNVYLNNIPKLMDRVLLNWGNYTNLGKYVLNNLHDVRDKPDDEALNILKEKRITEEAWREYLKLMEAKFMLDKEQGGIGAGKLQDLRDSISHQFKSFANTAQEKIQEMNTENREYVMVSDSLKECVNKKMEASKDARYLACIDKEGQGWFTYLANSVGLAKCDTLRSVDRLQKIKDYGECAFDKAIGQVLARVKSEGDETVSLKDLDPAAVEQMINLAKNRASGEEVDFQNLSLAAQFMGKIFNYFGHTTTMLTIFPVLFAATMGVSYLLWRENPDSSIKTQTCNLIVETCTGDSLDAYAIIESISDKRFNAKLLSNIPEEWVEKMTKEDKDGLFMNILKKKNAEIGENNWRKFMKNMDRKDMFDEEKREHLKIARQIGKIVDDEKSRFVLSMKAENEMNLREKVKQVNESIEKGEFVGKNNQWIRQDVPGDGACFFRAVANAIMFITTKGLIPLSHTLEQDELSIRYRMLLANAIENRPDIKFLNGKTIKENIEMEENYASEDEGFKKWLNEIRDKTTYISGGTEIQVMSMELKRPIFVYDKNLRKPNEEIDPYNEPIQKYYPKFKPDGTDLSQIIHLSFDGRDKGSEHYTTLYRTIHINDDLPVDLRYFLESECEEIEADKEFKKCKKFNSFNVSFHPDRAIAKKDEDLVKIYTKYSLIVREKVKTCKENCEKRGKPIKKREFGEPQRKKPKGSSKGGSKAIKINRNMIESISLSEKSQKLKKIMSDKFMSKLF